MTDMADNFTTFKSFTPEFAEYFATAPLDELAQGYSDAYKDHHGIRPRWMNLESLSRMALAQEFDQLSERIIADEQREANETAALHATLASIGLTEWAERNNIHTTHDLLEHHYNLQYNQPPQPQPFPYDSIIIH